MALKLIHRELMTMNKIGVLINFCNRFKVALADIFSANRIKMLTGFSNNREKYGKMFSVILEDRQNLIKFQFFVEKTYQSKLLGFSCVNIIFLKFFLFNIQKIFYHFGKKCVSSWIK